jgi:hypothetical protein
MDPFTRLFNTQRMQTTEKNVCIILEGCNIMKSENPWYMCAYVHAVW